MTQKQAINTVNKWIKEIYKVGFAFRPMCIKLERKRNNPDIVIRFDYGKLNKALTKSGLTTYREMPVFLKDKRLVDNCFNKVCGILNDFSKRKGFVIAPIFLGGTTENEKN